MTPVRTMNTSNKHEILVIGVDHRLQYEDSLKRSMIRMFVNQPDNHSVMKEYVRLFHRERKRMLKLVEEFAPDIVFEEGGLWVDIPGDYSEAYSLGIPSVLSEKYGTKQSYVGIRIPNKNLAKARLVLKRLQELPKQNRATSRADFTKEQRVEFNNLLDEFDILLGRSKSYIPTFAHTLKIERGILDCILNKFGQLSNSIKAVLVVGYIHSLRLGRELEKLGHKVIIATVIDVLHTFAVDNNLESSKSIKHINMLKQKGL